MLSYRLMPLLSLLLLLVVSAPLGAAGGILDTAPRSESVNLTCPGPLAGLSSHPAVPLRKHGLDPAKLRITLRADRAHFLKADKVFDITYDGKDVGTVALEKDDTLFTTEMFSEMPELKGKGVGAYVYVALAKKLFKEEGRVIRSSSYLSSDAVALWERLESFGFATRSIAGDKFRRDFLESNQFEDVTDSVVWPPSRP